MSRSPDAAGEIDIFGDIPVDEPSIPLASCPLHCDEGRQAFLRAFTDVGETLLFQAVAHVWSSLAEQQEPRCTAMGLAAGTGGKGKAALVNVLRACLEEILADENPLLARAEFDCLDAWHEAAMACFVADEVRHAEIFQRYSMLLDARVPQAAKPHYGEVVAGPWSFEDGSG